MVSLKNNKIYRGCANDIQTCHQDVLCWFCEKNLCNTVGGGDNLNRIKPIFLSTIAIIITKFLEELL
uniref:CSON003137 protein n=1 Tax=Culicoides sonorensis TaxID=179676 RepID=A0A336ML57_CULSO